MNDVIIIGGSVAGHSHGLLGHDHKPPLDIRRGSAAACALSLDQAGQCPGRERLRHHRRFLRPH
ncbi:hypothetical protein [Pectobacterium betavasculorum]|uniref:hypothetical protein n=1 Tax=Pectobacterium betavasculorum TaxID=55207 RepID=UPI000AD9C8B5|nr:hypothetical protein [Pectobacterium betavasculorum]